MKQKVINKTVIVSMIGAGVTWGAWAYFVNKESDNVIATTILQVIYSTLMTIYMSYSIHFTFSRMKAKWSKLIMPTIFTVGHTSVFLIFIHHLNNTLNIFKTVSLPIVVATAYSLFLSWKYYDEIKNS